MHRRGRSGDPLYGARKTLLTGQDYLTMKQQARLDKLFAHDHHQPVKALWQVYQRVVTAFRNPNRQTAKADLTALIGEISSGVSNELKELQTLDD